MAFAKDTFGHLKAIAFTAAAQPPLDKAGVEPDPGVFALDGDALNRFIVAAKTRPWTREPGVRLLA